MKVIVAVIITAVIMAPASFAAASWSHMNNGVWCKSQGVNVLCIPTSGTGYGVGISRSAVLVYNIDSHRSVFQRYQP